MKTIAILTFHSAKSYGAALQAFALCEFLRNRGFKVYIINLRPPSITRSLSLNPVRWLSVIRFNNFERTYFTYFPALYRTSQELKENPPMADYYIVGSDQVWNPEITQEYQLSYFFDFVPEGKKIISYAASFGKSELIIEDKDRVTIQKLLHRFSAVSVREDSAVHIAKKIFNVEAQQVLDPTLLLSDYSNLTGVLVEKKQIVCFKFHRNQEFYETMRKVGLCLALPVLILNTSRPVKGMKNIPVPSVERWLKSIQGASLVVTDSFHAVAFCIIFRRNFIVIPANRDRFTRIESLLRILGLDSRIYYSYDEIINDKRWQEPVDYQEVALKLEKYRTLSIHFLEQALV
jgi:hypothetical protein